LACEGLGMKGCKHGDGPSFDNQFMAEISHELGNVLNGLLGMTRLVRDSGLNAEQDRWLKAIEQSGQQLRRLVEAIRQGPAAGGSGIESRPVALDGIDLLEQLLLAHAPAARARANRLLLTVSPGVPRHWVSDPRLVRQLLDNLLGNALKFTRAGEAVLEVSLGPLDAAAPGTLVLAVTDSGPGIDSQLGHRMFGAYERGAEQVRDSSAGYGLGLFICRRIVQALGGSIAWSAAAGGGARFEVALPGVAAAAAAPASLPGNLLRTLECRLDLGGSLERSVRCCLARLGVACRASAGRPRRDAGDVSGADLLVSISKRSTAAADSGLQLALQAETRDGRVACRRQLALPVLESSLGPLLLELALEALWLRNARRGSAP
jgi:hypothetical protein